MSAKILVVDDERCMRDLMQLHLRSAGHQVLLAEDAVVAGRMLLEWRPDLLLVDVEMPYMSGQEFVATLLADRTIPHVPVIFVTADETFGPRAASLGADCLTKPCRADVLLNLVARRLKETRPRPARTLLDTALPLAEPPHEIRSNA